MSDQIEFDYDDYEGIPSVKPLREHARNLEKQLRAALKTVQDKDTELQTLGAQVKKSSLADLLKAQGIDPKFAARADRDGAEATEDGVKAWVEENKDFYNFTPAAASEPPTGEKQEADPPGQPNVDPTWQAAVQQAQALDSTATSPSDVTVMQKLQNIDPSTFETEEQFRAALAGALNPK